MRLRFLPLFLAAALFQSARADMVNLSAPSTYTPGVPFTVSVGLTPVQNFGLYNIELVFKSSGPTVGLFTVDSPVASTANYPFFTAENFLATGLGSGNQYRLTLSDFLLDPNGPDVVLGLNDRIADLTGRPSNSLTGPLSIFVERNSLFLDDANGISLLSSGPLPAISVKPNAVPAPAGLICLASGMLAIAIRRGFSNRKKSRDRDIKSRFGQPQIWKG